MVRPLLILSLFVSHFALGQSDLNEWLNLRSSDAEQAEQLYLEWQELQQNPIAINFCSRDELLQTGLLNIFQVHNLIQYREREGLIYSSRELILVKGFSKELIRALESFIDFRTENPKLDFSPQALFKYAKHDALWRWQIKSPLSEAFKDGDYLGDPLESRIRYQFQSRTGLSAAINLQKDPGEKWTGPLLFDHSAFYLRYKSNRNLRQILVGDFQFQFGQGLSLWSGSAFDASAIGADINRYSKGFRAFAGNEENRFFRGLALEYQWRAFNLQPFISYRKLDAREEIIQGEAYRKPVYGGYHRSETEIARRKQLPLSSAGLQVQYENQQSKISLLWHGHRLGQAPIPPEDFLESLQPDRQQYSNLSTNIQHLVAGFFLNLELSFDADFHPAAIFSWQKAFGDHLKIAQQVQQNSVHYVSWWASAPGPDLNPGATAFVQQIEIPWTYHNQSQIRLEYQRYPWPRYQIDGPSAERQIQILHRWHKFEQQWDFRFRYQNSESMDGNNEQAELQTKQLNTWQLRLIHRWPITRIISCRSSIQYKNQNSNGIPAQGQMISQQWNFELAPQWQHIISYSLSDIDQNAGALYNYEADLRYGFSIPASRGQSLRFNTLSRWKGERFGIEAKISYLYAIEEKTSQWDFKIQCRYHL